MGVTRRRKGWWKTTEDDGPGNASKFSADDLEKWYRQGELVTEGRILGRELNHVLSTTRFHDDEWYLVTDKGQIIKL